MKTMKTITAFCLCLLIGRTKAIAQLTVYGGPQLTSAQYSIRSARQAVDSKIGFMAGAGLKTWIEGNAYFAPQLYFSQKGYSVIFDRPATPPDSGAVNNNVTVRSVELSPMIQLNFSKKASYLFVRFGPAFELALSGRERFDSANGKHVNRAMNFDFDAYSFATVSAVVQVGFQHKSGFLIFAHYEHGLSSLNNSDYGPAIFHRIVGLSVGWKLGKKR